MKALEKMGQMVGAFKDVVEINSVEFTVSKPEESESDESEDNTIPTV
jgi:hypothetical protein